MATNVVMPQLGESVVEGTVGKWLKNVGDAIAPYEPIMEVITDKVTTEIPSPAAGTLTQILVPEGTTVKAGTVVALIGQANEVAVATQASATPPASAPHETASESATTATPVAGTDARSTDANGSARGRLTPVVARMISEYNITDAEMTSIRGTGGNGRISKKDIESYLQTRPTKQGAAELPAWEQPGMGELFRPTEEVFGRAETPAAIPAPAASEEAASDDKLIPLSPMRRSIAEHMVRSSTIAPHVTTVHEADMTRVLAHFAKRQDEFARQNVKLTYTPYFIEAVVYGLQQVPLMNAQYTPEGIAMKRDLNIGIAVALEDGLIVPVIKNADDKSLLGLARSVNDLATRAREKRLQPAEVTGGTFTLTNYGVFGSLFGTPIISQPQSAILGIGAIQKRPIVINDAIAIRQMVYLALSFDHRLLDGAVADTFMKHVRHFLENYSEA